MDGMTSSADKRILVLHRPGLRAWLDSASPFASAIESDLDGIAAIPERFTPIPTRNRMNKVWEGRLDGLSGPFIIKQGWVNPVYPADRRLARRVNLALHNRFLQSMKLSFRLETIGFASVRPVLCWKKYTGPFPSEIGILYPKIEAPASLARYLVIPNDLSGPWRFAAFPSETARAWGRHTRRLNEAGLLHIDPAPWNILIRPGAADPPREDDFIYIDTDAFRPLPFRNPSAPFGRWKRALAMDRVIRFFEPGDLSAFCEGFALPSESPAAWLRLFTRFRRYPKLRPVSKVSLFLRSLPVFRS